MQLGGFCRHLARRSLLASGYLWAQKGLIKGSKLTKGHERDGCVFVSPVSPQCIYVHARPAPLNSHLVRAY